MACRRTLRPPHAARFTQSLALAVRGGKSLRERLRRGETWEAPKHHYTWGPHGNRKSPFPTCSWWIFPWLRLCDRLGHSWQHITWWCHVGVMVIAATPKFNVEPENSGFQKEFPFRSFSRGLIIGSMLKFREYLGKKGALTKDYFF